MKRTDVFLIIDPTIFPYKIVISLNQTDMGFENKLRSGKMIIPEKDGIMILGDHNYQSGRTILLEDQLMIMMRLNYLPTNPRQYGLLVHELYHIVDYVMNGVGVNTDEMETPAHYISYLAFKIIGAIGINSATGKNGS